MRNRSPHQLGENRVDAFELPRFRVDVHHTEWRKLKVWSFSQFRRFEQALQNFEHEMQHCVIVPQDKHIGIGQQVSFVLSFDHSKQGVKPRPPAGIGLERCMLICECHSSGFLGKTGRGTHEYRGVMGRIDIITGTLGKALGGASGGFTSGRKEIIEMLRQRSRPYLFSNTVAPSIVGASIAVLDMLTSATTLRDKLEYNTNYFRNHRF